MNRATKLIEYRRVKLDAVDGGRREGAAEESLLI